MDPVQLATAALLAHLQATCLPADHSTEIDIIELGVGSTALAAAVGADFSWEGDPCGTSPVLRLGFATDDGTRRLTVRPRIRPHQSGMKPVTVTVQRGTLRLETPGTLLHDAVLGQTVKVRNDAAHTTLSGVLVTPDLVEVP